MLRLRLQRILRQISQDQLAELTAIPRPYLSHFESGRMNPTDKELTALGRVLGCQPERLLDHVDESRLLESGAEFADEARR